MTALWFVVGVLATYRVARMIALEDGPFDIFSTLRERVSQKTWVGRGLHCVLCISVWLAFLSALLLPLTSWKEYILISLALSGGVVVVHKVVA